MPEQGGPGALTALLSNGPFTGPAVRNVGGVSACKDAGIQSEALAHWAMQTTGLPANHTAVTPSATRGKSSDGAWSPIQE